MKALVVKKPWIDKILSGAKVWELRSSRTQTRGLIALIQGGSGTVVGVCEVVDVKGPLSVSTLRRTTSRHRVPREVLNDGLQYRSTYAWVLRGARRLRAPIRYRHPSGAVIWVKLTPHVVKSIGRITPHFSGRASRAAERERWASGSTLGGDHYERKTRPASYYDRFRVLLVPVLVEAQQPARVARVGWLSQGTPTAPSPFYEAFRQGMRDLGYVEGQNLVLEPRYTSGKNELWPELIADMDRLGADVIVAGPFGAVRVAKQLTSRPIVMTPSADPVVAGVVQSLARPGGNITGITEMAPQLTPKRLEMLKQIVPTLSRVAILWQPGTLSDEAFKQMLNQTQGAARPLGIQLQVVEAKEAADFDAAFAAMVKERAEALIVLVNPMFNVQRRHIIERAEKHRLPAIYEWKEFVRSGGLISYGADVADIYRRAAGFVDKILKGVNPAELPVEGPTRFDMAVNLKTAKALGLTIPAPILTQVVEALE